MVSSMDFFLGDWRNWKVFEMFFFSLPLATTWFALFSVCLKLRFARNKACWTNCPRAGSVCTGRCSTARSRTAANCCTKLTSATARQWCELAVHGTHTACLCYWVSWQCMEPRQRVFAIGFSFPFVTKIDTACLCYSVFCDLDVKDRSCIARKERFLFWWSFLGQSRQIPQNSDPKDLSILHIVSGTKPLVSHLHVMFSIMCLPLFTASGFLFDTIQFQKTSRYFTFCQVLNLWSATYTWCSISCACHCSLLLASCLTQFSSKRPLDTSHSVRY